MDLKRRIDLVVAQLHNLAEHDDAPAGQVQAALDLVATRAKDLGDNLERKRDERLTKRKADLDAWREKRAAAKAEYEKMSDEERSQRLIQIHETALAELKAIKAAQGEQEKAA